MPTTTRTFRVFVSSTFEDLKEERNALQREVFPALAKLCLELGARFQAIDLRWGVREEASLDQKTMEICMAEIERCQRTRIKPNFIILLGDRYGWQPLPARIRTEEFKRIRQSITGDEARKKAEDWYQRDENAEPHEYLLKPRTGEVGDRKKWREHEKELHEILSKAARAAGLSGDDLIKYEASATHQEILKGLGESAEDRRHVFAFFRGGVDSGDSDIRKLKKYLKGQLGDNVFFFAAGNVDELCKRAHEKIEKVILNEVKRFKSRSALDLEIEAQHAFAQERSKHFVGRGLILDAIAKYLQDDDRRPLVIQGPSGSGKSAIVAQASGAEGVIRRFIGTTPDSSNGPTLLRSLCMEIARRYGQREEAPATFNELATAFSDRIRLATPERPLTVFIDALDQLGSEDPAATLHWLPQVLPSNCKVVVSTIEVPEGLQKSRLEKVESFAIGEAHDALSLWLGKVGRRLRSDQHAKLLESFGGCPLPLYLKLAFEEARLWKSFDPIEECVLGDGLPGIIERLFTRLSQAANHGEALVTYTLGFLTAARYGLAEDEILAVLATNDTVWEDFERSKKHDLPPSMQSQSDREQRRLPVIVWSRLYLDLAPYLNERMIPTGTTVGFFHRQLRDVIAPAAEHHRCLADYFRRRADPGNDRSWTARDPRPLSELPYHLTSGGYWLDLDRVLSDPVFGEARCIATGPYALSGDCHYALRAHPSSAVSVTEAAVRGGLAALLERPELSLQTLVNRMDWVGRDDRVVQEAIGRAIRELDRRGPWIQAECAYTTGRARSVVFSVVAVAQCSSTPDRITVVDEKGELLVFDLGLGLIEKRQGVVSGKVVAIQPIAPDRIAWLDSRATVRAEGTTQALRVRKGECRIASFPNHGVFAVDPDGRLVLWSPDTGSTTVLAEGVPSPVRVLRSTANGGVVCVAGKSPQRLLVLYPDSSASAAMDLAWGDASVMDADIDQLGQCVLLLCADRSLRLLPNAPGGLAQALRYEQGVPTPIWGAPLRCALGSGDSAEWAFFATQDGQVGAWNWKSLEVRRLPDFGGAEHESMMLFEFPRASAHLRVGLQTGAFLMDESTKTKEERAHSAPITACTITTRGATVSVSQYDGAVCWYEPRPGLRLSARHQLGRITAISSIGKGDDLAVGTSQGWCWRQSPDRDAERDEIWCLFDRAVAAVVGVGESIIAADIAGRAISLDQSGSAELLRPETGRIRQIALHPSDDPKSCWSLHALITSGDLTYRVTRWNGSASERDVYRTTEPIVSFNLSADQRRICVGGRSVIVFATHNANTQELYRRDLSVLNVVWIRNDLNLAVLPNDGRWLEVWSVATGLPTIAAVDLPGPASCMAVRADAITVGFGSGDLLRFRLRVPLQ